VATKEVLVVSAMVKGKKEHIALSPAGGGRIPLPPQSEFLL